MQPDPVTTYLINLIHKIPGHEMQVLGVFMLLSMMAIAVGIRRDYRLKWRD